MLDRQPVRVLIVPGWNGSGPGHWQRIWREENPAFELVQQRDWHNPTVHDWAGALQECIVSSGTPAILVGHSLGCLTVAWWARLFPSHARLVDAALMVAPPDLASPRCHATSLRDFAPPPRERLPFPSILVGSENDPYMSLASADRLAADWDSHFINAGYAGHINAESGYGHWPKGQRLLNQLIASSQRQRTTRAA